MLNIVVPLAGPDFETTDGSVKAEYEIEGVPLLRKALESRSWWPRLGTTSFLKFVLRDSEASRRFASEVLARWYPDATCSFLGGYTRGAALSALAGLALCDPALPVCVDLADILYVEDAAPEASFAADPQLGAIALTFSSNKPFYSYIIRDETGRVIGAREKQVVSNEASAGTYFFRNLETYMLALGHSLRHADTLAYNGLFYVCPLLNGITDAGANIATRDVYDVNDIKIVRFEE